MPEALDDFSSLVTIKTPDDLLQRPLYQSPLNHEESKLAEVLAQYHFDEPYPCGISSCRTPHQTGYMVKTEDRKETNIGSYCGVKYFGNDFRIKANEQDQRARLKYQLDTLNEVRQKKTELLARIAALFGRDMGTKWAERTLRDFKDAVGHQVFRQLHEKAQRGETAVEKVRGATQEEKDRHQVATGGKPLQFISEKLGDLSGLDFLTGHPERELTNLKNKLYELDGLNARDLSAKTRKDWVDWAGSIERIFEAAEDALANAIRFFTQQNFDLVAALGTNQKEQDRLNQVQWSDAEKRVIVKPEK